MSLPLALLEEYKSGTLGKAVVAVADVEVGWDLGWGILYSGHQLQ